MVHKDRPGSSTSQAPSEVEDKVGGKTPEELALENEHLRTSLDAIASHAEKLEQANKALREQHDEREKAVRSIAVGMKREVCARGGLSAHWQAQKVKQGQEMIRSQLMASVSQSPRSARASAPDGCGAQSDTEIGELRILEFELMFSTSEQGEGTRRAD